ncbi:hypothetical protein A9264_13585 [Vibrio sp. UCD-FRSSP16_10]|uniref:ABC1 kinase family protein n=1 Tax=unclassified Vibrio TaxID=2614977 RepID=UPI0007FB71E7|nr:MULTISPECIES: AarF/UbiB family protein [unclassified Vibrio]OBT14803.1 hypothetical protein A9260_13800 [Vibrio sp. UCD-FRSSP16_30]OBT20092.1 hypothetical protein A9264_13585 [Vibrio sp. UCD-FRSSP16_10]
MKLNQFSQFKQNTSRFHEIIIILSKYGLANWVKEKDPDFLNGLFTTSDGKNFAGLPFPIRLRMAFTELGTSFIKLGQMLSTRADIIGPDIAKELALLQSDVPSDSQEVVTRTIENEFATSIDNLFKEFNFTPIGSASIGQVHQATLLTGQAVVVKVQHADIEDKIRADIDILELLAKLAEKYDPELRLYQPQSLVRDFCNHLLKELDYSKELSNMELIRHQFKNTSCIHIPEAYSELSGKRVLTMERLTGFSIGDKTKMEQDHVDGKSLADIGVNMYLDMVFKHRVFHADPHPGNLWVMPDNKFGLLDFGMVGRLDEELQEAIENMLLAAIQQDSSEVTYQITRVCSVPKDFVQQQLQDDVGDFIFEYFSRSLESVSVTDMLNRFTEIIRIHHIMMPTGISLLIRVLILLEGSSHLLDRNFSINSAIEPYANKMRLRRMHPNRFTRKLTKSLTAWERLLASLPTDLETIVEQIRSGQFDVNLKHRNLDAVVNRLVYGVLTSALLLGGSMLLSTQVPPLIHGVSVIGGVLLSLSGVLGLKLLKAVNLSGNLIDDRNKR